VTTQYTLDINNSLSQVLADDANRYLYGMGRIAQQTPGGWQYFLPDALGSARQLTDAAGALALTQSFDPYGGLLASQGSAATPYGFTSEWGDGGLIYLRARYYLPQAGIFTARDPFPGVATLPVTLQPYLYAAGNPLRYTDPSGQFIFLPLLAVAAVGGLVGGVGYYALQMYFNHDPCARWEWKDAVFWGGVGTGLGALLGVGIFGGWWVGAQLGWWGLPMAGSGVAIQQAAQEINSWPSPWQGRQIINGIEYTVHALERMMPSGIGGRGIPPSVVENAIRYGTTQPGREPGTIVHIYENVMVVTDALNQLVITVIRTSH
jgi:RHS repeat-associated protein